MGDAERIWLGPECCAEPGVGRTWCSVNEWACCPAGECDAPKPTEYVRADLVAAREAAAAEAMREAATNTAASFGDGPFATRRAALAINALPLPAPDALARALEQARAEEREAHAQAAREVERLRDIISEAVRCIGDGCEDEADRLLRVALAGEGRSND